jgi:hypothetical protein
MAARRGLRCLLFVGLLPIVASLLGSGPPIVRVRVPSERVSTWFPLGTELKVMHADTLEELVRNLEVRDSKTSHLAARLLRARHFARWNDGKLDGRSELVIQPARDAAAELFLEPWAAAVSAPSRLRSTDDGRVSLVVEPGDHPVTIEVPWQLSARPGTNGRKFRLGLPRAGLSEYRLELPDYLRPVGPPGICPGSEPSTWLVPVEDNGRHEPFDLFLVSKGPSSESSVESSIWSEGLTAIEIRRSGARWSHEAWIQGEPRLLSPLIFELDPGLEVTDVKGSLVENFQIQRNGHSSTVSVSLRADHTGTTETRLSFEGVPRIPLEGRWLPRTVSVRNAIWRGERTRIHIDDSRIVESVKELGGRQVSPGALARQAQQARESTLVFESHRAGFIAEIMLRRPWADVTANVLGWIEVGNSAPRLKCQIAWSAHRGQSQTMAVDLPSGWHPERVELEGPDDPLEWHSETLEDGHIRLYVRTLGGIVMGQRVTINLHAVSSLPGGVGPLSLPRVRPVGVQIAEELWAARVDRGFTLRPKRVQGLAWIDGEREPALRLPETEGDATRLFLAWRWTGENGEAVVERERVARLQENIVREVATVTSERLRIEARIAVAGISDQADSILVGLNVPITDPSSWRFFDEATGLELAKRLVEPLDGMGTAWLLPAPQPPHSPASYLARHEGPRRDEHVPLVVFGAKSATNGILLLRESTNFESVLTSRNVRRLDAESVVTRLGLEQPPFTVEEGHSPQGVVSYRKTNALAYRDVSSLVDLHVKPLVSAPSGVVQLATLTTYLDFSGTRRDRLVLRVLPDQAPTFELTLPTDATLDRVRRDGQPVTPSRAGTALLIPVNSSGPSPGRGLVTLVIEYHANCSPVSGSHQLRPARPRLSFPCLAFDWNLVVPQDWDVVDWGAQLVPIDPSVRRVSLSSRFGLEGFLERTSRNRTGPVSSDQTAAQRDLDMRASTTGAGELSLGVRLTRWDAGSSHLVVDRVAMDALGLGPRSRSLPARVQSSKPGVAESILQQLGLTSVAVGRTILITDRTVMVRAQDLNQWEHRLEDAAALGSDDSGRFQSVALWREESTPRSPGSSIDSILENRPRFRFSAVGWPDHEDEVVLIDRTFIRRWAYSVSGIVFLLGLWARRFGRRVFAGSVAALLAGSFMAMAIAPPRFLEIASAATLSTCCLVLIGLGASLPRFARRRFIATPRSTSRSSLTAALPPVLILLAVVLRVMPVHSGEVDSNPILVLFPYDGSPRPEKAPDRAILRLSDYRKLTDLAHPPQTDHTSTLRATNAVHVISRPSQNETLIESEYTLESGSSGSASWKFPTEGSYSITARLDGSDVPVSLGPEGREASVQVTGADREHKLAIRRLVVPRAIRGGEAIALRINSVVSAQLVIEAAPGLSPGVAVGALGASSNNETGSTAQIGPVRVLEARWSSLSTDKFETNPPRVDALYLWDALQAGDRLRARFTYRQPPGSSVVRFKLGLDESVGAFSIPGQVDVKTEVLADHREWEARIDPPLASGSTIALEVWRSSAGGIQSSRAFPLLEPLGVDRSSTTLAFRKPADWTGRLAPSAGQDVFPEDLFVREWGRLPDDGLTLSGVVRLTTSGSNPSTPVVETCPASGRYRLAPSVELEIRQGRVDLTFDSVLEELDAPSFEADLTIPEGLNLTEVDAEGLTDWSQFGSTGMRFRFDGPSRPRRRIRIAGWLPILSDPLTAEPEHHELPVPWPTWRGAEVIPGTLGIRCQTPVEFTPGLGVRAVRSEKGTAIRPSRAVYRVDSISDLDRVRWSDPPPRLGVHVVEQVTVDPDSAEWTAVVRYDVSGGPLESIQLKLSNEWAKNASVRLEGMDHDLETARGESTQWLIHPKQPIWNSQRILIRSTIPFVPGESRSMPDVTPLARSGEVDRFLRIANATTEPLSVDEVSGVEPVRSALFPGDELLPASTRRAEPVAAFHVVRSGWTVRISKPMSRSARLEGVVETADVDCLLRHDGWMIGTACFELPARGAPFLEFELPPESSVLHATVRGLVVRPLKSGAGLWKIPLSPEYGGQVSVVWESSAPPSGQRGPYPLALPAFAGERVPVVVSVRTPRSMNVTTQADRLTPSSAGSAYLTRASWIERSVLSSIPSLDRSSRISGENFVANLVRFELALRQAERSTSKEPQLAEPSRNLMARLYESLNKNTLSSYLNSARVHVGLAPDDPSVSSESLQPPTVEQVHSPGAPRFFQGTLSTSAEALTLNWSISSDQDSRFNLVRGGGIFGVAAIVVISWLVMRASRPSPIIGGILLVFLLMWLPLRFGLMALGIGIGLVLVGWLIFQPGDSREVRLA